MKPRRLAAVTFNLASTIRRHPGLAFRAWVVWPLNRLLVCSWYGHDATDNVARLMNICGRCGKYPLVERQSMTPMLVADVHVGPECLEGKHPNCDGSAWCERLDEETVCVCSCHGPDGWRQ